MQPKQIIALSPADRLALSTRARVGGDGDVRDYLLSCAWISIDKNRAMKKREKVAAFMELCRTTRVIVER